MDSLRIGLDFDGVFGDCEQLKNDVAEDLYGTAYRELQEEARCVVRDTAYGDPDRVAVMDPIPDVFQYIAQLKADGHDLVVITSRDGDLLSQAEAWYEQQCAVHPYDTPDLSFIGVGYHNDKRTACNEQEVDVFVDDDLHKLEPLVETVPHRFHFINGADESDPGIATPVRHWEELYQHITELTDH